MTNLKRLFLFLAVSAASLSTASAQYTCTEDHCELPPGQALEFSTNCYPLPDQYHPATVIQGFRIEAIATDYDACVRGLFEEVLRQLTSSGTFDTCTYPGGEDATTRRQALAGLTGPFEVNPYPTVSRAPRGGWQASVEVTHPASGRRFYAWMRLSRDPEFGTVRLQNGTEGNYYQCMMAPHLKPNEDVKTTFVLREATVGTPEVVQLQLHRASRDHVRSWAVGNGLPIEQRDLARILGL